MDQPYIDALVNQALGAYKAGGDDGLKRWKEALPAPHLEAFEKHCSETLLKAIAGLDLSRGPGEDETAVTLASSGTVTGPDPSFDKALRGPQDSTQDVRKKHTRDRRRTKPL